MDFLRASRSLFALAALVACGDPGEALDANGDRSEAAADTTVVADPTANDATTPQDGSRAGGDARPANERDAGFDASDARFDASDARFDASDARFDASDGATDAATPFECPELANANPWQDLTGSHSLVERGEVLACAHVATFAQSDVANSVLFPRSIGAAVAGYDLFVVQYLSEGKPGIPQAVTGLFYLPTGNARQLPIAAVSHYATGMGPSCGPTHNSASTDQIAIPLVGLGYAVVATDYAGMGVDSGMSSYLIGDSEAAANLDALRALRRFQDARFDATRLGTDFFVLGHSQGGHAALFTQEQFDSSMGVTLLGSRTARPASPYPAPK
jgi:hypothetical protein